MERSENNIQEQIELIQLSLDFAERIWLFTLVGVVLLLTITVLYFCLKLRRPHAVPVLTYRQLDYNDDSSTVTIPTTQLGFDELRSVVFMSQVRLYNQSREVVPLDIPGIWSGHLEPFKTATVTPNDRGHVDVILDTNVMKSLLLEEVRFEVRAVGPTFRSFAMQLALHYSRLGSWVSLKHVKSRFLYVLGTRPSIVGPPCSCVLKKDGDRHFVLDLSGKIHRSDFEFTDLICADVYGFDSIRTPSLLELPMR